MAEKDDIKTTKREKCCRLELPNDAMGFHKRCEDCPNAERPEMKEADYMSDLARCYALKDILRAMNDDEIQPGYPISEEEKAILSKMVHAWEQRLQLKLGI